MTREEYLNKILAELEKVKERKGRSLYKINEKSSNGIIEYLRQYFKGSSEYTFETRRCAKCTNTWDIIITINYQ